MRKYIDAEAFKRRILSYGIVHEGDRIQIPFYKHYFAEAYVSILRWVCEEVDDTPTADVEEVVRCKDCKYLDYVDEHEKWCMGRGNPATMVKDDGYCEIGKRKEES